VNKKNFVIERDWMQGKYHCLIVFQAHGHRCGYVGVNKSGLIVNDEELDKLEVHGSVTYLQDGCKEHEKEDYRYVGFDCMHICDNVDIDCLEEYFPSDDFAKRMVRDMTRINIRNRLGTVKTQEFVESEMNKLIKQLDELNRKE